MGKYHEARQELRAKVEADLRRDLEAKGHASSAELDELLAVRSERLLDAFEVLVLNNRPRPDGFWRGLLQSVLGSFLFVLIAGLFLYAVNHDYVADILKALSRK